MQVYVTVHMRQAAQPLDFSLSPFPPRFTNGGYNVVTFAGAKEGEPTEDTDDEGRPIHSQNESKSHTLL